MPRSIPTAPGALALIVLAGAAACSGGSSQRTPTQRLTPADFAAAPRAQQPAPLAAAPTPRPDAAKVAATTPSAPRDVIVLEGAPPAPAVRPAANPLGAASTAPTAPQPASDRRVLVDQMVGQINGRPVYADAFFRPMDARLRREAERLDNRQWIAMARRDIEAALWDKLRDDLLLAEFESALTPEQRMGVLAFVETVRADLVSGNLGSESIANRRLLETEGLDLNRKVQDITQRRFILEQLRRAIGGRVQISFRDVQVYYEQNIDDFIPPPIARFTILRVPVSDTERLARAEGALASGEDFKAVAARESNWRPESGNGFEVTVTSRDYAAHTLFGVEALNLAAQRLAPGQVTPRTDVGSSAWWIRLDAIDQPPGRSLYEAQLDIEQRLRAERVRQEETRYFAQLFERGSFSDFRAMAHRLLEFGAERYLVHGRRIAAAELAAQPPAEPAPAAEPEPNQRP